MTSQTREYDFDFVVIGSGFGGSVTAHRLVEKGYRVAVMEMGRRWTPENLPKTSWSIHRWFWRPNLALRGFFNMRFFRHVTILHGCAVGGGSITYACTLLRPPDRVWDHGSWKGLAEWKAEMPQHYATASRMLGVTENKILGPADLLLKKVADAAGIGDTFYRTHVAIFQSPEGQPGGQTFPDPYFGGEGPERTTCTACGGCMMGCRHGAKNTLDQNYLYLAEKHGAKVFAETRVVNVKPLNGMTDGSAGYEVLTVQSTARFNRHRRRFTCRGVVFSASSLGTMELLFQLKEKGSLPAISDQLGRRVRTNSESLIGVRVPGSSDDLSKGVAIGSGVYLDEHTHIEAVRYPAGSDAMSLLATILTGRPPGPGADRTLDQEPRRFSATPSLEDDSHSSTRALGARMRNSALHAGARRPPRHAMGAACLLAVPQVSGQPRAAGRHFHSPGQRVCREVRADGWGNRDEHVAGNSVRCSRYRSLPGRGRDRRVA